MRDLVFAMNYLFYKSFIVEVTRFVQHLLEMHQVKGERKLCETEVGYLMAIARMIINQRLGRRHEIKETQPSGDFI